METRGVIRIALVCLVQDKNHDALLSVTQAILIICAHLKWTVTLIRTWDRLNVLFNWILEHMYWYLVKVGN